MTAFSDGATHPVAPRSGATGLFATGGLIGAVLASSCCILPLAFVMLGVSGVWIGGLTALAPYQPIFVLVAFVALARGFWLTYRRPKAACGSDVCASPGSARVKAVLWTASLLLVVAAAADAFAPMIL